MAGVCPSVMLVQPVLRSSLSYSTHPRPTSLIDALNIKYGGLIVRFTSVVLMPLLIAPTSILKSVSLWMVTYMATWSWGALR